MSTIVRYSSGSTYTLVPNKVDIEKVQDLDGQYHIPNTSIVGMMRLGLGVQRITVSGDSLDMSACLWHDVVAISFDSGTSYQTVYFAGVPYSSDCWSGIYPYALSLFASPLREGAPVRYPSSGYKWGNQSITGISQAGNVNAYPIIHYLAPLFYAPLSNTLIDFAGQSVTFTRTASKTHKGVVYPINTPIFDSGLYLASDTAQDVATWTPPASTVRTVAMQLKSRYPSPWSIGGGGVNLLTANQSNAETDTTGWAGSNGTLTRNTTTPIAGAADFKMVVNADGTAILFSAMVPITAGRWYCFQQLVRVVGTVWGGLSATIQFYNAAGTFLSENVSAAIVTPTVATRQTVNGQAPTGATQVQLRINLNIASAGNPVATLFVASLMLEMIPNLLTIFTHSVNNLYINTMYNILHWADGASAIETVFPTAAYLNGAVTDIVLLDDISHAVTVIAHAAGGTWYTATGTFTNFWWALLVLGYGLEGSIANLICYPYVLTSAEYQAMDYSSLALKYNTLFIGNRYPGEVIKGSDKRLLNANGSDISALLGGTDIPIGASAVTIAQSQGQSARWYVEVKRTDV